MTQVEFDAVSKRLEELIAQENAGKKGSGIPLANKVVHNRVRNLLQEVLRQHKLSYFELVPTTERS